MTQTIKRTDSVFLIDDDKFLLDMYALKFKECGCAVQALDSAQKALGLLREGANPNIILLDVIMPEMTGFEFLETIKKEGLAKDSVIIVLSNQGQQEDVEKAMALGASGYIIKASAIPSEVLNKTLDIVDKGKK